MYISKQVGWMTCIACSDSKLRKGMMYLGKEKSGLDSYIECPICKGTQQVPKMGTFDPRTGREIDYERLNNYGS